MRHQGANFRKGNGGKTTASSNVPGFPRRLDSFVQPTSILLTYKGVLLLARLLLDLQNWRLEPDQERGDRHT